MSSEDRISILPSAISAFSFLFTGLMTKDRFLSLTNVIIRDAVVLSEMNCRNSEIMCTFIIV